MIEALAEIDLLHRIKIFQDGRALLNYFFSNRKYLNPHGYHMPKAIILDLKLPKVDGLEVLQRIRSEAMTKMIPTIIFTSSTDDRDRLKSYELGANSYVIKPIPYENFVCSITGIVEYWTSQNIPPY